MRPYDLRHAFCSLLIGEGMSVVEVAPGRARAHDDAGDLGACDRGPWGRRAGVGEASIRAAREAEVSGRCPRESDERPAHSENPRVPGMGDPGLEPGTSSLSASLRAATVVECAVFAARVHVGLRSARGRSAVSCVSGVPRSGMARGRPALFGRAVRPGC
jgi:hypothetical protein